MAREDRAIDLLLGAGRMGGAMLERWIASGMDEAGLGVIDPAPSPERVAWMRDAGVRFWSDFSAFSADNQGVALSTLIVAVKPAGVAAALEAARPHISPSTLILSVAAGVRLSSLLAPFPEGQLAVRAMPNTPALLGKGAMGLAPSASLSAARREGVERLLSPMGSLFWLEDEALLDAVTALSGSGPAYVFYLAEAMRDAGVELGLDAPLAEALAARTIEGAGAMLMDMKESAAELRGQVTSPGGTTEAALRVLMKDAGLSRLMRDAMRAAWERSRELGETS